MTTTTFTNQNHIIELQRRLLDARAENLTLKLEIARLEASKMMLEIQVRKLTELVTQNERTS